jgi:hypothetical protein
MKATFCWMVTLLFAVSCWAQKNEVDVVLGNTWSFNSNTAFSFPGAGPATLSSGQASSLTYDFGLARRLTSFGPASLSMELNAAGFQGNNSTFASFGSVFIVPAAKFSFLPRGPISPFVSAGVGYVHLSKGGFNPTNAVAYGFGGGVDLKTAVRFLNIRAEARDFLASQSGVANAVDPFFAGVNPRGSFRNHVLVGAGLAFRF